MMDEYAPTIGDKLYMRVWYPLRYDAPDKFKRNIANHAPDWLVYHVTIRAFSTA